MVEVVLLGMPLLVGTLYAPAAGGEVVRGGNPHCRPVIEHRLLLHQALTESLATHDDCSVVVLQGSADKLACRCGVLIDYDHKGFGGEYTLALGVVVVGLFLAPRGGGNEYLAGQKEACQLYRLREESSAVAPEVED